MCTVVQILEKSKEANKEIWIAAVDYTKAFDSVEHASIWQALREQGVPDNYVTLLKNLYKKHMGQVIADKNSKEFDITRGVKQGDPLSTLLFNALLEKIFRSTKSEWYQKGYGIEIAPRNGEMLTNIRFADDVLLFAGSEEQMRDMMNKLSKESAKTNIV